MPPLVAFYGILENTTVQLYSPRNCSGLLYGYPVLDHNQKIPDNYQITNLISALVWDQFNNQLMTFTLTMVGHLCRPKCIELQKTHQLKVNVQKEHFFSFKKFSKVENCEQKLLNLSDGKMMKDMNSWQRQIKTDTEKEGEELHTSRGNCSKLFENDFFREILYEVLAQVAYDEESIVSLPCKYIAEKIQGKLIKQI